MASEIWAAGTKLDERKGAIVGGDHGGTGLSGGQHNEGLLLLSGFDLDPADVEAGHQNAAGIAAQLILAGEHPVEVASTLWLEGVALGLQIAQTRSENGR